MTQYNDDSDRLDEEEDLLICKKCGTGELHWQAIIKADGRPGYALFTERNRKHVCGLPNVDDFKDVK
jgi:hypothetical protein